MRIDVLRSPAGTGHRPWDEHELRSLLGELALRGIEVELVDPAGRVTAPVPGRGPSESQAESQAEPQSEPRSVPQSARGPGSRPGSAPAPGSGPGVESPERPPGAEVPLLVSLGADPVGEEPHLRSRLEQVRSAVGAGRPVVVSGLALDPATVPAEALRELLSAASLVGLRDESSLAVARRLCPGHPALRVGWEDALLLPQLEAPSRRPAQEERPGVHEERVRIVAAVGAPAGPFSPGEAAPVLAAALDALVHRTEGVVTLLACGGTPADEEFAAGVAALLREDVRWGPAGTDEAGTNGSSADPDEDRTVPDEGRTVRDEGATDPGADRADPDAAGAVLRRADYVLTTCGRAAVLGLAAHAVVLPVAPDKYSLTRMDDVLSRWGLHDGVAPLAALLTPGDVAWDTRAAVQQWATEAVEHRGAVRSALADVDPVVRESAARWWDDVVGVLRGGRPPGVREVAAAPRGVGAPVVRSLRRRYTVPGVPPERSTVAVVLRCGHRSGRPARALDDVLAQTFTDWRLVVVDDGGDPVALDELLAQRWDELAGRVTVLHHRRPMGPGAAANRGLRAADSELVVLHDGSDRWSPLVLQGAVARLENPLVADDGVVVRAPGERVPTGGPGQERVRADRQALTLTDVLDGDLTTVGPTFLYRRAVHGVLGDYDETLDAAADWEFVLRFLETFTAGLLPGDAPLPAEPAGGSPAGSDELAVRDRHLRQWTAENGIGLPLYLRRAVAEEAGGLHRRLDAAEGLAHDLLDVVRAQSLQIERMERTVREKGFVAFCRRLWRSLRGG
ncbi:glycosyltransferase [Kocuria sp. M1N1S27]|uniref:glycosyltransferase n=1 Tax=Kocuria kalidii TaxID=3376283 RepID=UPI0037B86BA4